MPLGRHAIWKAWGSIVLGQYAIGMAWGGMGRTWMECPYGGLEWDALVVDLDGMALR